jgi:hypothetical protein
MTVQFSGRVDILKMQLILIAVFVSAFVTGLIIWYVKYKPLRDNALRLINELKE